MSLRFPPLAAVNSRCTLCGGSGWRYVAKNRVTRCQCRTGRKRTVVSIVDHKSNAAGER
jgi:hypothetical protein